jgi:hypothetical protein
MPNIVRVEYRTIKELEENNKVDFYILEGDPDFYLFSSIPQGDYRILAKVDSKNVIEEADENNNEKIVEISIKDTKALHVVFFRIELPEDFIATPVTPRVVPYEQYEKTCRESIRFVKATYPISEVDLVYEIRPEIIGSSGIKEDCVQVEKLAKRLGADVGVGIVPYGYFGYWSPRESATFGITFPNIEGVLVEYSAWTTVAHEIAHVYGLRLWDERLGWLPWVPEYCPNRASGYWVTEGEEIINRYCFMSDHIELEALKETWVCNECFKYLFKKFRVDKKDPEILIIEGTVYKDGKLELGSWFKVKEGWDSLDKMIPGEYSIKLMDEYGNILQEFSFDLQFWASFDPIGIIETDFASFCFAIPYAGEASVAKIFHDNMVMAEVDITTKLLGDGLQSLTSDYTMLIRTVEEAEIESGVKNSLLSKLLNAKARAEKGITYINEGNAILGRNMLNSATNIVNAFINEVNAQKAKKISETDANAFISWAQLTILALQSQITESWES